MTDPSIALAGFVSLLAVGGSVVGFLLSTSRLKATIEGKGREDQRLLDAIQHIETELQELKAGQALINSSLNELQISNQKEHGELIGKIRDLEKDTQLRLQALELGAG